MAPCHACSARRRGRARATERRGDIDRPWAAEAFDGFCEEVLFGPSPYGAVVQLVDRAASFFVAVGRAFATPDDLGGSRLRAHLGAEALRRAEAPAAYLCRSVGFDWEDVPDAVVSGGGLDGACVDLLVVPTSRLAADYERHLASARGKRFLSRRTRVAYLRAAKALMAFAEEDGRSEPNSRDVRRLLWRTPGDRASLGPFLIWLKSGQGLTLPMPHPARRDRRTSEKRLLASAASLMTSLEGSTPPAAGRALLAACLSRLFGLPLERVLKLRWQDVRRDVGIIFLIDDLSVEPPSRLAAQFDRVVGRTGQGLLFPGRSGQRPLSTGAVLHHVRKVAPGSRSGRSLPRR